MEHDYMNDPRLEEFKDCLPAERQVYAWRLEQTDKLLGMTLEQRMEYHREHRKRLEEFGAKRGVEMRFADSPVTV